MPFDRKEALVPRFRWLVEAMLVIVFSLAAGAVLHILQNTRANAYVELDSIANLKLQQLNNWLDERYSDAQVIAETDLAFRFYGEWSSRHDEKARTDLQAYLGTLRSAYRYLNIRLVDAQGKTLLSARESTEVPNQEQDRRLAQKALAEQQIGSSDLYLVQNGASKKIHLDFIVPAKNIAGRQDLALILEADLDKSIFPDFFSFPIPTESGEVLLFRREGNEVLYLNQLRFAPDTALALRLPYDLPGLLAGQALSQPGDEAEPLSGVDYRGVNALGVARAVKHMPWYLIAKKNRSEIYASSLLEIGAIVFATLLVLLAIPLVRFFFLQNHALILARVRNQRQSERLEDLRLVEESEKRFQDIAAASADWVWETNVRFELIYSSPAVHKVTGFSPEQVMGKHIGHFSTKKEVDRINLAFRENLDSQGELVNFEHELTHQDGSLKHLRSSCIPIFGAEGELLGYRGVSRDFTSRKQTEEKLLKMLRVVEQNPHSIVITDVQRRIEYVNNAFTKVHGYTYEEAVGQKISRLLSSGETASAVYESLGAAIAEGSTWKGEFLNRRRDGQIITELASIAPIRQQDGSISHYLSIQEDITEQKSAAIELERYRQHLSDLVDERTRELESSKEEAHSAREEADNANKAKSLFLANMSHEIRTPMNAIIGLSHLCLQTGLNDKQRDYVNKVHHSATLLLGIINDILDFSKIEAGKLSIEKIPFSLSELLSNQTYLFAGQLSDKKLDFHVDISPGLPDRFLGDPLRIGQVLTNLLSNAIKFTEAGRVDVAVKLLGMNAENMTLEFTVADSGIGLTREQCGKLFNTFTQADSSTTRKYGGTGLGLTICKQLVEMMGGEIKVCSQRDIGSTFSFTIQLSELPETIALEDAWKYRVLVVDDENMNRVVLRKILLDFGVQVVVAESGEAALAKVAETDQGSRFDVIFMDWHLPGIDGFEAIRQIREQPGHATVPAVMVTAADMQEIQNLRAHGVDRYLFKPIRRSTLLNTLYEILHGQTLPDSHPVNALLQGQSILLVEDNEFNQQVGRELLENEGASVDVAADGQQAIAAVGKKAYDLVLMDMQMPVMDGVAATRVIRANPHFDAMPIIAMTANVLAEERQRCMDAGMNDFVSKPILPELLNEVLSRHLKPKPAGHALEKPLVGSRVPVPVSHEVTGAAQVHDSGMPAPAIDVALGLRYTRGNQASYDKLLGMFQKTAMGAVLKLDDALVREDFDVAQRTMHSMRGMAGTVGAVALASVAEAIETCLKNERTQPAADLIERFKHDLHAVLAHIEAGVSQPQ